MYVNIQLPDEEHCDRCPLFRDKDAGCRIGMSQAQAVLDAQPPHYYRWRRPQECIDASAEVENAVVRSKTLDMLAPCLKCKDQGKGHCRPDEPSRACYRPR